MRTVLLWFGLADLPQDQLIVILGLAFVGALLAGWISDTIMGPVGFSIMANGLIMLFGGALGMILYARLGYSITRASAPTAVIAFGGAAVLSLVLCASTKRFL